MELWGGWWMIIVFWNSCNHITHLFNEPWNCSNHSLMVILTKYFLQCIASGGNICWSSPCTTYHWDGVWMAEDLWAKSSNAAVNSLNSRKPADCAGRYWHTLCEWNAWLYMLDPSLPLFTPYFFLCPLLLSLYPFFSSILPPSLLLSHSFQPFVSSLLLSHPSCAPFSLYHLFVTFSPATLLEVQKHHTEAEYIQWSFCKTFMQGEKVICAALPLPPLCQQHARHHFGIYIPYYTS